MKRAGLRKCTKLLKCCVSLEQIKLSNHNKCKMEKYLSTTTDLLKSGRYGDLNIVLGNESCDLDSAVSSIVYAAFLYWQHNQIKCKVCTRMNRDESVYKDDIFVPILNVDREDYDLKTEVAFCLNNHGIDTTKLIFRNDFDLQQLTGKSKTTVTLVDHHILAKKDRFLTTMVTEIIDHRPIDRSEWTYKDDTRSTIELVGSCCSLVAQRIRTLGSLLAKETDFFNAFPSATDMLHCGIILDTVNFSKEVDKATRLDEDITLFLETLLKPHDVQVERKAKLDLLVAARKDVSKLSAAQLLRKDVKIVGDAMVPSFPILVEDFLKKPAAIQAVQEALVRRECSIALLLGMSLTDGLKRDGALYSPDHPEKAAQLAKFLQEWKAPLLQLTPQELPSAKNCVYFKQLNLSASRKQYMPALTGFLDGNKT